MSNELNQAAERLRRYKKTQCLSVYDNDDSGPIRDRSILANAYLREHLPDDDEAITEEWLDDAFHNREYGHSSWVLDEVGNAYGFFHAAGFVVNRVDPHASISGITTRGQLRELLRALGVSEQ